MSRAEMDRCWHPRGELEFGPRSVSSPRPYPQQELGMSRTSTRSHSTKDTRI